MEAMDAPAGEPAEAPEAVEPEGLDEAAESVEAVGAEPTEPEATEETTSEPAPAKPTPWDDDLPADAFTPEALSKPEGIQAAAKLVEEKRVTLFRKSRELDGRDIRLKEKARKLDNTKQELILEKNNFRVFAQEVNTTLGMLRNGTAAQRLDALGRLTGQTPRQAYEELTHGILRDGKPVKKTPEVEALEAKLERMEQLLMQREQHEQQAREEAKRRSMEQAIEQRRQEIGQQASDAQRYPTLAHFASLGRAAAIVDYAQQIKEEHYESTGLVLDDAATLSRIEQELAPSLAGRVATQPTSSGTPQKPSARAQRSPGQRSVTPSVAAQSGGSTRALTDEERLDELARDSDLLAALGFNG